MASESIYAQDGFWDEFDTARDHAKLAGDLDLDMGRSPTMVLIARAFITVYNPTSEFAFSDAELDDDLNSRLTTVVERAVVSYAN